MHLLCHKQCVLHIIIIIELMEPMINSERYPIIIMPSEKPSRCNPVQMKVLIQKNSNEVSRPSVRALAAENSPWRTFNRARYMPLATRNILKKTLRSSLSPSKTIRDTRIIEKRHYPPKIHHWFRLADPLYRTESRRYEEPPNRKLSRLESHVSASIPLMRSPTIT